MKNNFKEFVNKLKEDIKISNIETDNRLYDKLHSDLVDKFTYGQTVVLIISREQFLEEIRLELDKYDLSFIGYLNRRLSVASNKKYLDFISSYLRKEKITKLLK